MVLSEGLGTKLQVWWVDLTAPSNLSNDFSILDCHEKRRANLFKFEDHRRRFVVSHAVTRRILGNICGCKPKYLKFQRNSFGKPRLSGQSMPIFNLSSSNEIALCAVVENGELGIDVEFCRTLQHLELSARYFAAEELAEIVRLPDAEQNERFFAIWTLKEAYIKAKGLGLSIPLNQFAVSLGSNPKLTFSDYEPLDVQKINFCTIPVVAGYCAALAYSGAIPLKMECNPWI